MNSVSRASLRNGRIMRLYSNNGTNYAKSSFASSEFYDHHANTNRIYFYRLDDRGNLYLEQTLMEIEKREQVKQSNSGSTGRNITTALKDAKFLKFFYTMLRPNTKKYQQSHIIEEVDYDNTDLKTYIEKYPFVSLCGTERNFMMCDDTRAALGFTELQRQHQEEGDDAPETLIYGGAANMSEPFKPDQLMYSEDGKVYHPITQHKRLKGQLGLLHPHLAANMIADATVGADGKLYYAFKNKQYSIINL
jgi:hypothetical protein